jgi:hypothetical protein
VRLIRWDGPAVTLTCSTCGITGVGGSEEYTNASRGEVCQPDEWYTEHIIHDETQGMYCAECAAKLVEQDPTRSVNQFFSDTAGNDILPENLTGLEKLL